MALDPITAGLDLASTIVGKIWPDKSALEQQQLAGALAAITAQTDINKAEAQSTDPMQHWRGGLGWVCVAGFAWNYVLCGAITTIATLMHNPVVLAKMDMSELSTLTMGMLGLGGLHVFERVKGATK